MKQYLDLMRRVRETGTFKADRTGTGTYSVFGHQMRFDLADGFPLVTTKKCHLKSIIHELLWFLAGDTNIAYLREHGVRIWDEWVDENGNLGPVYGAQWRSWPMPNGDTFDKISDVLCHLRTNPDSRRMVVSAWNVAQLDQMALPPCHCLFQFYTREMTLGERLRYEDRVMRTAGWSRESCAARGWTEETWNAKSEIHKYLDSIGAPRRVLSCQLYQRSADIFLGVPFNIAGYALLTMMIAQVVGMAPGEFVWAGGDCHLYSNHLEQADLHLTRDPLPLPTMKINPRVTDLFAFRFEDFELVGYQTNPHIAAPVAV